MLFYFIPANPPPFHNFFHEKQKFPEALLAFFSSLPCTQYPSSCTWPWLSLDDEFWLTAASIGQEPLPKHTGLKWSSFRTVSQFYPSEWHPCVSVRVCVCMCVNVSWACLVVFVATSPSARVRGVWWGWGVWWGGGGWGLGLMLPLGGLWMESIEHFCSVCMQTATRQTVQAPLSHMTSIVDLCKLVVNIK